jgi:hypothetical protein
MPFHTTCVHHRPLHVLNKKRNYENVVLKFNSPFSSGKVPIEAQSAQNATTLGRAHYLTHQQLYRDTRQALINDSILIKGKISFKIDKNDEAITQMPKLKEEMLVILREVSFMGITHNLENHVVES